MRGLSIGIGTIYPILKRLACEGLVESYMQPSRGGAPRKYHRLTPLGRQALAEMTERWSAINEGLHLMRNEPPVQEVPVVPAVPMTPGSLTS